MNEVVLTESRAARGQYRDDVDALDKVKVLDLMPDDLHVTTEMVATYFEISIDAIKKVVQRNRDELTENGLLVLRGDDLRDFETTTEGGSNERDTQSLSFEDAAERSAAGARGGRRALALFTRRTVLNVAMLLAESDVARQTRRALLDRDDQRRQPAVESGPDLGEVKTRLEILDLARSMAVLPMDDIRHQAQTLLADVGMAERPLTIEEQREAAVLRWIHQRYHQGEVVSIRDIYRGFNGRSWVHRVADVEPVVARLIEAGHLAALPQPPTRRGQPPSPQFEVLTSPDRPVLVIVRETAGGAS